MRARWCTLAVAKGRIAGATHSLIDYNRCGTPLIELGNAARSDARPEEAASVHAKTARDVHLAIGISDCSMEEGSLRCDGNVSLASPWRDDVWAPRPSSRTSTPSRVLHDALAYEICRQAEVLEEGGIVYQETRHWEPFDRSVTVVMRVKETADDYRLFPEPDMAPFDISDEFVEKVRQRLPELPDQKAKRFEEDYGLSAYDARHLVEHRTTARFFEECMKLQGAGEVAKPLANLIINDVSAYLNNNPDITDLDQTPLTPPRALELVKMIAEDKYFLEAG